MVRKDRNAYDPAKPALILTYGRAPGKIRPLDRECLVVGRAPACDLVLNSPEVSPVHCLVIKTASGWVLRNTNPRVGTQLNGQAVQDAALSDDDCIQIGTFSFKVHLPGVSAENQPSNGQASEESGTALPESGAWPAADDRKARRLRASRQKVVRLAWNLRRRLLHERSVTQAEKQALGDRYAELEQRTQSVDARQRECDKLMQMLMEHEEEVSEQRQALLDAASEFDAARQRADEEFAQKTAQAEAEIKLAWEQVRATQGARGEPLNGAEHAVQGPTAQAVRELELRKAELDAYARSLQLQRQTPQSGATDQRLIEENQRLRTELALAATRTDAEPTEVVKLRADLKRREDDLRRAEASSAELETLRKRLASREDELRRAEESVRQLEERGNQLEELRVQNTDLSARLVVLESELKTKAELDLQSHKTRAEVARLESDAAIGAEMKFQVEALQGERDGLRGQLLELDNERTRLMQQCFTLQAEVTQAREDYETARTRLQEQERELVDKVHTQKENKVLTEELKYLREKVLATRNEMMRLQEQQAVWEVQSERLADVDALRAEKDQLQQQVIELGDLHRERDRLQKRVHEQGQELAALRERLRQKDEELRSFRAIEPAPQSTIDAQEHADLVAAVETLLRENEEFRQRLLSQARLLKDACTLEERCAAQQAEIAELRAKFLAKTQATVPATPPATDESSSCSNQAIKPSQHLHKENEELKARLAAQETALVEREQLQQKAAALEAEIARLNAVAVERAGSMCGRTSAEADASWHDLVVPTVGSDSLLGENDALRNQLAEQRQKLLAAERLQQEYETLRAELERQRQQSATVEGRPAQQDEADVLAAQAECQRLTARIEELEGQIRLRDEAIATLQAEIAKLKQESDYEIRSARELELQNEREFLLAERSALESHLSNLREDRRELDAAAHAAEIMIAKERVQIANEWAELNRKREEHRMEVEREKREHVRENLDRVRRIKEESQVKREGSLSTMVAQRIGERRLLGPNKGAE